VGGRSIRDRKSLLALVLLRDGNVSIGSFYRVASAPGQTLEEVTIGVEITGAGASAAGSGVLSRFGKQ